MARNAGEYRVGLVEADEVISERRGGVLVITINRPQAKNALNLGVATAIRDAADELVEFSRAAVADGLRDAVLLGMGGSSLAPEVLWRTFGAPADALDLHVLDSTDPAAISPPRLRTRSASPARPPPGSTRAPPRPSSPRWTQAIRSWCGPPPSR